MMMALTYGWKLTLAMSSYVPIVIATNVIFGKVSIFCEISTHIFSRKSIIINPQIQATLASKETKAYALAANVLEEVLGGIRTVISFCGEQVEIRRYDRLMEPAKAASKKRGMSSGIIDGLNQFLLYASQAFGFWYGAQLILDNLDMSEKDYTPAAVVTVRRYANTPVEVVIIVVHFRSFSGYLTRLRTSEALHHSSIVWQLLVAQQQPFSKSSIVYQKSTQCLATVKS